MATLVFGHRRLARILARPAAAVRHGDFGTPYHLLAQSLCLLGQRTLGWPLLLFAAALILTLWLLPLGLPLGLLALGLIAAPRKGPAVRSVTRGA